MERETRIELAPPAWKAGALPLSYSRTEVLEYILSLTFESTAARASPQARVGPVRR